MSDVALVARPSAEDKCGSRCDSIKGGRHFLAETKHVRGRVLDVRHADGADASAPGRGDNSAGAADGAHLRGGTDRRDGRADGGVDESHFCGLGMRRQKD